MIQFLYYVVHELCHEGITGKRGGECHGGEYEYCGMGTFLFPMEFLYFCGKIPSLLHF